MKEIITAMEKQGYNLYFMDSRFLYFNRGSEGKKIELITLDEIVTVY